MLSSASDGKRPTSPSWRWLPDDPLTLPASRLRGLAAELHAAGITGGAVYDALVAVSAASHDATLLTLDRRAEQTYQRCSARYELLANVA